MINNVDIDEIVVIIVSNKLPVSKQDFKYFIGYKDAKKVKPLCIFFLETNAYRIDLHKIECISFLMKDKEFLEKYNKIWEKVTNITIKKSNSKLIYNKKHLKAEKKILYRKSRHQRMLSMYSVYIKDKNYYPQVFLEKNKHIVRKEKHDILLLMSWKFILMILMIIMILMKKLR